MAKKKVYAVRVGQNPSIYNTWAEAETQVKGYPGAQFKSFNTMAEAEDYTALGASSKPAPNEKMEAYKKASEEAELEALELSKEAGTIVLHTDGSRKKVPDTETIVFGYSCIYLENEIVTHKLGGASDNKAYAVYENVAGELMAVVEGLKWIQANRPDIKKVVLFYDYQGIGYWADGSWRAKNIMTRRYVEFMNNFRRDTGLEIVFNHVKGHTGNRFNEMADIVAGEAIDTFVASLTNQIA